jgi:hypothetical protein
MSSGIPMDTNARNLSCQLGGLTFNGNVSQGTANSVNVVTINDPGVIQDSSHNILTNKFLQISIAGAPYYIQLYQ